MSETVLRAPRIQEFLTECLVRTSFDSYKGVMYVGITLSVERVPGLSPVFRAGYVESVRQERLSAFRQVNLCGSSYSYTGCSVFSYEVSESSFREGSIVAGIMCS